MSCCEEHSGESELVPTIQIGKKVPSFIIKTYNPAKDDFDEVSLQALQEKGKWAVLFFYPADFTFVCPTELADLADQHKKLSEMGVEVVSMSADTRFAHMAWRKSEMLLADVQFQMGEDPTGDIARHFGIYNEDDGMTFRGTFIISPDGVLVGSEINFNNVGRNAEELVRKLEANVYLRDKPAEVCPARWKKGDKTLTPSKELVGNVQLGLK